MSATRKQDWVAAALQLAVDAGTVEMVDALAAEGIRSILLKGAAIATRLYADPSQRRYGDFDLLVDPGRFTEAERIVERLGYVSPLAGARERWDVHAIPFSRGVVTLDLHHTLFLSGVDRSSTWDELSAGTRRLRLGGGEIEVLGEPALALLIAAHLVHHGTHVKPRRDMEQALARFDLEVWAQARDLAEGLAMVHVLAAGLAQLPEGQARASELNLSTTISTAINLRLGGQRPLSDGFVRLSEAGSPLAALRVIAKEIAPSPAFMRHTRPAARRGTGALALAYLQRALWLARNLPRALLRWRDARRGP